MTARRTPQILTVNAVVVALAVAYGYVTGDPGAAFGETGFVTFFSCAQLATIAFVCDRIGRERRGAVATRAAASGARIWRLMALGFAFLALDEVAQIHEKLDYLAHTLFIGEETALSDRLDDLIVGAYAAVGLWVMHHYRGELTRHRAMRPFLVAGFVLLGVMVVLDALTNRADLVGLVFEDRATMRTVLGAASVCEDGLKLAAEGVFLAGFLAVRARAAEPGRASSLRPVSGGV